MGNKLSQTNSRTTENEMSIMSGTGPTGDRNNDFLWLFDADS